MATSIGSDQELLCPICAGPYNVPRKLPGCIHSFCETCILTFIQNLKKEKKLGEQFDCPVCRLRSKSPEEDNVTIDWVQSLDKDKTLETKLEKEQEYGSKWCSQCKCVNKFIKSKVYCASCQESFCESCSETLHSFHINSKHVLIDVTLDGESENIHEKAVDLVQKFLSCPVHSKRSVEFFCPNEEKFCCASCATTNHQLCENIKPLQELTENGQDEKNSVDRLLGSLQKLSGDSGHLQTVISVIKEKDAELKKSPEKIEAEFQAIREKVLHLFDVAQERILQDSRAHVKAISLKHWDEIQQLDDTDANITADVTVIAYVLNNLIGKLPNHSAVVCYKKTRCMLQNLERKIAERSSVFMTSEVLLGKEESFDTILNLGPNETEQIVSVHISPKTYLLPRLDEKFLLRDGKVEIVGEKNISEEDLENPTYNSITFLPDDNLVLTDKQTGVCLLLDTDSQPINVFNVQGNNPDQRTTPYHIYSTCLANGLIAISVWLEKKIMFLSESNEHEKKGEILCKFPPTAIHGLRNGDLGVLWAKPVAFSIITICGGSYREKNHFKTKAGSSVRHRPYMAVDEDRLHVVLSHTEGTNSDITGVTVFYDFNGNIVYEYSDPDMKDPRGMALDADGNVYICDCTFGKIYVLSPEGLLVRTIKEGCPADPCGIGFRKSDNVFAVSEIDSTNVVFFAIKPP